MPSHASEPLFAGKFRLVKRLGRGAMGEVWLADEVGPRNFSRQVAVKRLLATEGISDYARESFLAEAQVIARLDHPNIVHLIELGETDDRGLYLVLDYIDGAALDRVIRKGGALSAGAVALIGREVAKALDAVHSMVDAHGHNLGVVHRDVSPANILIGRDGRIRLSDFGVARIHGLGGEKTETGVFKGKLPYMPPEQALGEPFDGRADLFSLGVTLHEALYGGRLRKAETQGQLITMIATERVVLVRSTVPDAMPEIAAAIDAATEFRATQRTPTAGHLAAQFHAVLHALGPRAEEQAIAEICERVAIAAGAPAGASRQPWSMALSSESPAYGSGPRSISSSSRPGSSPSPAASAPRTGGSVPPEAAHQASVTRVASISDASARTAGGASSKTWFFAMLSAVLLGCGFGALYVFLSPPKRNPPVVDAREAASIEAALSTSAIAASTGAARPSGEIAASSSGQDASASGAPSTSVAVAGSSSTRARPGLPRPSAAVVSGAEETGNGTLTVTVNPWGNVSVDGRPYGMTPIGSISLPAGPHTVVVVNPDLQASRSQIVKVIANKNVGVRFDLKKNTN